MKHHIVTVCVVSFLSALIGCATAVDKPEIRKLVGSTQTLRREALIYPLNGDVARHFEPGTVGFYNIEEGSNSWRKEGRLSPGTTVKILEVNRYLIDARGHWVGVVGLVQDPETHREVKFLYCWSSGDFLERAPWEDESIPERRDIRALP